MGPLADFGLGDAYDRAAEIAIDVLEGVDDVFRQRQRDRPGRRTKFARSSAAGRRQRGSDWQKISMDYSQSIGIFN